MYKIHDMENGEYYSQMFNSIDAVLDEIEMLCYTYGWDEDNFEVIQAE